MPDDHPGFDTFWRAWPRHFRKSQKGQCLKRWVKDGLEAMAAQVIARVLYDRECRDWTESEGQYIPAPLVWLNGQKWDDDGEALAWWERRQKNATAPPEPDHRASDDERAEGLRALRQALGMPVDDDETEPLKMATG